MKILTLHICIVYSVTKFGYFILQISNLEVWFQRPKDVVRKLVSGDLDLGIVGLDTVLEFGQVSYGVVLWFS